MKQKDRPRTTQTQTPRGHEQSPSLWAEDRTRQGRTLVGMPARAARSSPATAALLEMTSTMCAALLGSRVLSISACRFEPEEEKPQQAHPSRRDMCL